MDCDPVHLTLRDGATPTQIRGHRNVAEPLMQMFHDELTSQIEQGLVRPVPPGAVTPFISGVVTMPKDSVSGGVRITVDFRELNKWLVGTIFPNNTPFEAVRSIPTGMNYFTMFDGLKGYHMVPLDEESMTLTTFSTPFGLFQYTRLPMGICHAGDSFSSRYHKVFGDLPIAICVEDMCAYAKTYEEMLALNEIIKRAQCLLQQEKNNRSIRSAGRRLRRIPPRQRGIPTKPRADQGHRRIPTADRQDRPSLF